MKHSHTKIGEVFDQWASTERAQRMADGHRFAAEIGFQMLDVQPTHRYLDIGCGLGYSVRWAASIHSSVDGIGIDVSNTMIEEANALSKSHANAQFRHGQFPDVVAGETFDRVFSVEALYYLPDLGEALSQVFAHVSPGGRFVTVIDYYRENDGCHDWSDSVGVPLVLWSISEWRQGLLDAGFEHVVAEQRRHPSDVATTDWQQRYGSLLLKGERPA